MQLPVIGSVYNSMKTMQLNLKWQQRQNNLLMPKGTEQDPQIEQLKKQAEDVRKGNAISAIDAKLKSGAVVTDDELEYLRTNSPELYQKAIAVKREREQYKKELESCKTKDDVEKLNARKMQSFLTEARVVSGNPNIMSGKKRELLDQLLRRVMGVNSEHTTFVKSKEYTDLPRELELLEGKKKRNEQTHIADDDDMESPERAKELLDFIKNAVSQLKENAPTAAARQERSPAKPDAPAAGQSPEPVKIYNAKGSPKDEAVASGSAVKVKAKISAKA